MSKIRYRQIPEEDTTRLLESTNLGAHIEALPPLEMAVLSAHGTDFSITACVSMARDAEEWREIMVLRMDGPREERVAHAEAMQPKLFAVLNVREKLYAKQRN